MSGRVTVLLTIEASHGRLTVRIAPALPDRILHSNVTHVELSFWPEGATLVRGRLRHLSTGTSADFQGARPSFEAFAAALDLAISQET